MHLLFIGSRKIASIGLSFFHGSGALVSLHDPVLRLEQLTIQDDQRSMVAEEKAIAAVTAIGMIKIPEQRKVKPNNRDAEKFWPETYTADHVDKKSFAEFLGEDVPECAGTRPLGETSAGVADRVE